MTTSAEYDRLRGALGVAEVVVVPPTRSCLSLRRLGFPSTSRKDTDTLGFTLRTHNKLGHVQVVSSSVASLRRGDVILGVNGRVVLGETEETVVALLQEEVNKDVEAGRRECPTESADRKTGKVHPLGTEKTVKGAEGQRGAGAVRLLIDTRHAWPATFFTRKTMSGGSNGVNNKDAKGGTEGTGRWRKWRRLLCLLDGFDTIVLDAQVSPLAKLMCHGLACVLLHPIMTGTFTALRHVSTRFGPLLMDSDWQELYEAIWSLLYLTTPGLLLLSYLFLRRSLPAYATSCLRLLSRLFALLQHGLYLPPLLALASVVTTGLTLPQPLSEAQLEADLQQLITDLLVLLLLPLFAGWYLRRFSLFCAGVADVANDRPQRLSLVMPLSSHFVRGPASKGGVTFDQLRGFSY